MANKISNFAEGNVKLTALMQTVNAISKNFHQLTLTDFNLTSESQIAAGSVIECNGAIYYFEEDESISGSPSDGAVYIMLVPSSDSNSDDFVYAEYTNTAPTWSDEKQGWYDSTGNYKYLKYGMLKSGSSYVLKYEIIKMQNNQSVDGIAIFELIQIGLKTQIEWDLLGINITGIPKIDGRRITKERVYTTSQTHAAVNADLPDIPDGEICIATGHLQPESGAYSGFIYMIERDGSNFKIWYFRNSEEHPVTFYKASYTITTSASTIAHPITICV